MSEEINEKFKSNNISFNEVTTPEEKKSSTNTPKLSLADSIAKARQLKDASKVEEPEHIKPSSEPITEVKETALTPVNISSSNIINIGSEEERIDLHKSLISNIIGINPSKSIPKYINTRLILPAIIVSASENGRPKEYSEQMQSSSTEIALSNLFSSLVDTDKYVSIEIENGVQDGEFTTGGTAWYVISCACHGKNLALSFTDKPLFPLMQRPRG